ncbi:GAF domain-containing protein [Deinococcus sp. QL22]|uniref:GAF domain-containing protein n=1 Tax=Deinococcus sp. QL22 TaxID=2939437 RepID=UPI002017EB8E|nr:GAF domain-containing protein [Deinococcus sp. QL22]UQN08496.1 GAF domain-containing protein [Deinococcus sp. QL22]
MSLPSDTPARFSLNERLQDVTHALAASTTVHGVFEILLTSALDTVDATTGAVLLVNAEGDRLELAHSRGYSPEVPTIWNDGPLDDSIPAGAALLKQTALFFEHQDALMLAYPDLQERVGAPPPVATAVLPMFENQRALGLIVLDFTEPHHFTQEERFFLRTLSTQCGIALGRARLMSDLQQQVEERTQQVYREARAQEAFIAFTEAVGTETEVFLLAQHGVAVLDQRFPGSTAAYYECEGERWKLRVESKNLAENPELLAQLRAGLPLETPVFAATLRTQAPVFVDAWDAQQEWLERTNQYHAVATYPFLRQGEVQAVLVVGLKDQHHWTASDRALFLAVCRGLSLALDRAEQVEQVQHRNRALEAFSQLAQDFMFETQRVPLVRRAQEIVLSLLPSGYAVYYEPEGELWRCRSQVGDLGNDALQALVDAGFPSEIPTLRQPFDTGQPLYQDVYAQGSDTDAEVVKHIRAVVSLALQVSGTTVGIFVIGLFHERAWTATDRAVLETTMHSLGLALERAEHARELTVQRDMLDARTRSLSAANEELEAFAYSVSHDLRTPVRHLTSFAQLLRKTLGDRLDEKSARYLGIMDQAATRMTTLIDAILDLSRTSQQPLHSRVVDMGAVVSSARELLEPEALDRQVTWTVGPLPLVMGDLALLRQVMENLFSNALKYTAPRAEAQIEVWAEEGSQDWRVFVRDNGVGFDSGYTHKLFGVFQRLHRQEEFEGNGVGLANVRRVISRHGGTVTAEGVLDQGATFSFTLPKAQ